MDPGIIVGYLVAKLLGQASKFADKKVDELLDRLYRSVWQRLGGDKALRRLAKDPQNDVAQEWARSSIENAAQYDSTLREELGRLQAQLQQRAPDLLVYAPGAGTVVGVNEGYLIQGPVTIFHGGEQPNNIGHASFAVKLLVVVGSLLCVGGIGVFGIGLFSAQPGPGEAGFGDVPEQIPLAAGLFFSGFVLMLIASLAHGLRRRSQRPPY